MEKWITQTGTKTVESDLANFVHDPDYRLNHNHDEADALFQTLQFYLSDNLLGMLHPNILDNFTRWEMFPYVAFSFSLLTATIGHLLKAHI
jgi:hypothetical protein